jgi:hypothetical protein
MVAAPVVTATWDGAVLKRVPYPIHADLSPRARSRPGTSLTGVGGIRDMGDGMIAEPATARAGSFCTGVALMR